MQIFSAAGLASASKKKVFETMAGFAMERLGRVPVKGERFVYKGASFLINDCRRKRGA